MKRNSVHFLCGLPRGGATLLGNILAQNPRVHVTSPPGLLDVLFIVRKQWNQIVEFKATPNEAGKLRVLRGILGGFYAPHAGVRPVIFDKSRAWLGMIEMAEVLLNRPVKIVVPVRDIREVLASFERLWRTNAHMRQVTAKGGDLVETPAGRCEFWLRPDQPLGTACNRIKDAIDRGYRDRLHFVHLGRLTRQPAATLTAIYDFLGEPRFAHNFTQIQPACVDHDEMYSLPELPPMRTTMTPSTCTWPEILGPAAEAHAELNALWS